MTSDDTARAADLEAALPVLDGLARRWAGFARTEPEDLRQNAALRFWRLRDHGDPRQVTVGEIMAKPLPQLELRTHLDEAYRLLMAGNTGVLAVDDGRVVDIITRIDLIQYWRGGRP